ncbi:hypothetical protein [Alicyclobacillus macrosporangiidus]|uniref:Uncharacterized protein n=1 Tax=Alicyclobacillus macrosporangiidus TaxID=392015 RepID=A0A1I7KEL7_9BACL|nr:hypothetical protein [Alicyclobacillus macrosporangiidus]SFU95863.1 hypothetical protein SAMN05421543_11578 [Alicyclobacillus macrosporangiidus]
MERDTSKLQKPSPETLQALDDLFQRGWSYTYDSPVLTLVHEKYGYVIEADGRWKFVWIPDTVLQQKVKSFQEMTDAIHTFAYGIEHDLVNDMKRWCEAASRVFWAPWSIQLLNNRELLEQLEYIAEQIDR